MAATPLTPAEPSEETADSRWVPLLVLVGTFGIQGLILVTGILTARLLGVEGRGQVALVYAVGLLASQLSLGGSLPNAVAKCLAERRVGARDGLRSLVRRRGGWVAVPCAAAAVVMVVYLGSHLDATTVGLVVAGAVMTLQNIGFRVLVGALQGEVGHLVQMVMAGVAPQLLYTAVLVAATVAGWQWNAVAVLAAYFGASALGMVYGWRALRAPTGRPEDALDEATVWREARRNYVSTIGPIDGLGLDRLLVGAWLGVGPLGLYAAATAFANLSSIVGTGISTFVLPRVAMLHDDLPAQRALVRRWLGVSAVMVAAVVGLLELVVAPAIRIAFGAEFEPAIDVARWLVLADGLLGFRRVVVAALQGRSQGGSASWVELLLTPALVVGVAVSAAADSLVGIGVTMAVTGALLAVSLSALLLRQPVSPPSTTST